MKTEFVTLRFLKCYWGGWCCECKPCERVVGYVYFDKNLGWLFRTDGIQVFAARGANEITRFLQALNRAQEKKDRRAEHGV